MPFIANSAAVGSALTRLVAARGAAASASFSTVVPVSAARLLTLEDEFRRAVDANLQRDGKGVTFATAWLASDNTIIALLKAHYPELLAGMNVLAVDTLHLFPETHVVAEAVQARYGKKAALYHPIGAPTRAAFEAKHGGTAESLPHAEFDLHSKVGRGEGVDIIFCCVF